MGARNSSAYRAQGRLRDVETEGNTRPHHLSAVLQAVSAPLGHDRYCMGGERRAMVGVRSLCDTHPHLQAMHEGTVSGRYRAYPWGEREVCTRSCPETDLAESSGAGRDAF